MGFCFPIFRTEFTNVRSFPQFAPSAAGAVRSEFTKSARTSKAMYVCRKVKNSQARTGHQRGMGGRKTDDDDTHERHTDTNKLTRHTASGLPHILSGRTHHSGHVPPVAPPSTPRCQETNNSTTTQTGDRGERVRLEQACSASSNLVAGRKARTRPCVGSCEVSMDALLTGYWPAASPNSHSWVTTVHWMSGCEQRRVC